MQLRSAMLSAPIPALILRTAAPSMAAMIASGVCTLMDALLLGRLGAQTAAAVSAGFPLLAMIQTIGFTLGMGAGSFVSRSLGGSSREPALRAASTAFFLALLLSGALCALGVVFVSPLVRLLGASEEVIAPAVIYARFVLLSGPLLCMNLVLSSLLRAEGRTLPNMWAYGTGAAIGCALQVILIVHLNKGLFGSGIAMLTREAATLAILGFSIHSSRMRPRPGLFSLSRIVLADIMRSGLPTLLRQGLMSLSSALVSRVSASFGDAVLAGMGLSIRASALVSSAIIGFGQGFQPVCGFAFGAGDIERVGRAYRFCQITLAAVLAALGAGVFAAARPLLMLFSPEAEVAAIALPSLRAQSIVFFAQGAVIMMNMLAQATGKTIRASLIATSRQGYVLIPLACVLPRLFGLPGLILCQSVSDVLSLLVCLPLTRSLIRSWYAPCGCSDVQTASR